MWWWCRIPQSSSICLSLESLQANAADMTYSFITQLGTCSTVKGTHDSLAPQHKNLCSLYCKRFANADYVLARSLDAYANHPNILITYDIACQYSIHLVDRFRKHSPKLVDAAARAKTAVPKAHIQGHKDDCQYRFTLMYTPGAGMFGGETIETDWAETNKLGASTHEMAGANRHDHCNDHFGDINWRKQRKIGK